MRTLSIVAALVLGGFGFNAAAQSAAYPTKPVKLVVGFTPGGAADYVARSLGEPFGRALGQPIVIENRPGAGSSIAADLVSKAAPDGYTVLIASPSSILVNPALSTKLGYTAKDLAPITLVSTSPLVIAANPAIGVNSIQDLIARAKKEPGVLNFASAGNGSAPHLGGELFVQLTGAKIKNIPFRGGAPAVQSVIAGDTHIIFGTPPSVLPMIQAGRLRALAVTTRERTPLVPGVPGMAEAGLPEYAIEFWYGLFVPAATPPAIVKKIFDAATTAMQDPSVKAALAREGTEARLSQSPEQFSSFLVEDGKFWVKLVKDAGVKLD